jgi:phosphopantetheine adenylyltransferase
MDSLKEKTAKELLMTLTYDDMDEEQEALVVEYETEQFKKRIDELRSKKSPEELDELIHDWWQDYQMADGTEDNLSAYVNR